MPELELLVACELRRYSSVVCKMFTRPSGIADGTHDVINTEFAGQDDRPARCVSGPSTKSCFHWRSLLVFACLLCLPGCSGCQKTPPDTRPEPPETSSPPVEVPPEVVPTVTPDTTAPESQPAAKPITGSNKQPAETLAQQTNSSPKPPKSSTQRGNGSKLGGGAPSPGSSRTGSAANQTTSPQSGRQPQTASEALELAQGLRRTSTKAANRGDFGKAFDLASQAWDALRPFPNDAACKAASGQLAIELESFADRANALAAPGAANTKRLVEK